MKGQCVDCQKATSENREWIEGSEWEERGWLYWHDECNALMLMRAESNPEIGHIFTRSVDKLLKKIRAKA